MFHRENFSSYWNILQFENITIMSQYTQLPFAFAAPGELMAAAIALPLVCLVLVALRFYTRRIQRQAIGIDDWMSVMALVCSSTVL
jgi:hypothetical protein